MSEQENRLAEYTKFLEEFIAASDANKNKFIHFFSTHFLHNPGFTDLLKEKKDLKEKYITQWGTTFNIFKIISPSFYYEKLHSQLIKALLDPKTPCIANKQYMYIFVNLLKKKIDPDCHFMNNYKVKIEEPLSGMDEKGSIDILIHDNEKAIIIENKSNNAVDTNNQLAKYYKYVDEIMGLNVLAIVYLVLDPMKYPSFENYSDEYKEVLIPKIIKVLNIVPIIDPKGSVDFVHGFLEQCLSFAEKDNNQTAVMFIKQFLRLFKFLGGDYMSSEIDKKLFEKIFESKDSISIANTITEMVNNKGKYIKEIVCDALIPELQKIEFEYFSSDTLGLNIAEDINAVFCYESGYPLAFGFCSCNNNPIPEEAKPILKNLLEEDEFKKDFPDFLTGTDWDGWLVKAINFENFSNAPIQETKDYFSKCLPERYKSLIKKTKERLNL